MYITAVRPPIHALPYPYNFIHITNAIVITANHQYSVIHRESVYTFVTTDRN